MKRDGIALSGNTPYLRRVGTSVYFLQSCLYTASMPDSVDRDIHEEGVGIAKMHDVLSKDISIDG